MLLYISSLFNGAHCFICGVVILLISISPNQLFCQNTVLNFHQLTSEEGLHEVTNEFIYTDRDNITWIGSLDGVFKFDGKDITNYNIIPRDDKSFIIGGDVQSDFFEDEKGNIWFTTAEAINCYRKEERAFIQVKASGAEGEADKEPYAFHLENRRYLWVRSYNFIYRIDTRDPSQKKRDFLFDDFTAIRATAEENVDGKVIRVFGCYWDPENLGFEMIDLTSGDLEKSIRKKFFASPTAFEYGALEASQVIANLNGEVCFVEANGLLFFDPATEKHQYYPFPEWVNARPHMTRLNDQLILTTKSPKLLVFDLKEKAFTTSILTSMNLESQQPIDGINYVTLGRDSVLWVSARGNGVYYANLNNNSSFNVFQKEGISDQQVVSIHQVQDGGILSVNSIGEVVELLPNGKNKHKNLKIGAVLPRKSKLLELPNGEIWAKSIKGLGQLNSRTNDFSWIPETTEESNIYDFTLWHDSLIILGCFGSLQIVNTITSERHLIKELKAIVNLYVDQQDRLWATNFDGEVFVGQLHLNPFSFSRLRRYKILGLINQVVEDTTRNNILIASSTGLITIADTLSEPVYLTEQDGLPNQYIKSIQVDLNHNLWLGTNKGIIRYSPDSSEEKFRTLTVRDGLSSNEYSEGAAVLLKSGQLLFGSKKGLDMIPPDLHPIGKYPILSINNYKIHDEDWWPDKNATASGRIELSHKKNTITFELSAAEYTDPIRNKMKVYLYHSDGVDSALLERENKITYTYLPPDDYVFKFTACNAEGLWQPKKFEFPFTIKPPWHKRPEWIMIFALCAIGIAVAVTRFTYRFRLRTKQLELEKEQRISEKQQQKLKIQALQAEKKAALEQERDQINAEFHSILNDGLVTIKNTCRTIKDVPKSSVVATALGVIQSKTLDLFEKKRHLIWAINPENSQLDDLLSHVRYYSANLLLNNGKEYRLDFPEGELSHAVSSKAKYNLFMTIKELLHNTLKSANCDNVQVKVSLDEKTLFIVVADDGIGFDFDQVIVDKQKSYGLHKCLAWVNSLDGAIIWRQHPGNMSAQISVALDNLT